MADEIVERLAVELSLESEDFKKKITAINSIIKNTERDFRSAGNGVKNFENTFTGLDAKIQKTSKQIELYNLKLSKQEEEYEKNRKLVEQQVDKLNELEKTLGKNSTEWQEQSKLVQKNSQDLAKLGSDIRVTESNINKLSKGLEESKEKFNNLGNSVKTTEEKLKSIDNNAKLTESIFNELGSELVQSGNYFQKLGNQMNELTFKIDSGVQKITVYEEAIKQTSTILSKNKEEHRNLIKEINSLEENLNNAKSEYGENSSEAQKLKSELLQLKDRYTSLENEIEDNRRALDGYQTELNNTQADVNSLSQELRSLPFETIGNDLKTLGNTTKTIGQGFTTGVTVPIMGAGAAVTVAGTNFGTAMSKLQATAGISDKTSESFKALEAKALEMGSSTSFSASEAAEGLTFLSLAGWDVETSIERIEPVLRAAEAGGMDLALTADLVTDSMSAAGVSADDFTKYLDIAAQAQRKSNQSMQQLLEANIVAGGSFKMLNIPMNQSAALLGVLANRGIKGSEAGKALSSVFANLVTETGQAGDALDAMGISLFDSNGKQKDMVVVLKELRSKLINTSDGTSKLTEKQQAQYASMLGGKTQFDTLMALLDGLGGEYDDLVIQLDNSSGALDEMARIMKDNLGGQIDSMKSAIEGALIRAFVALEPVLSKVVDLVTQAANWFSSLDEEQQKNILVMAGVVAAIGPMLMGIGQLIVVGGNAVTLFGKLSGGATAASGAAGGLTSAAGILASPIGIGAIIAVLVGLVAWIGDSETALLSLQEKFGGVGFVISSICEFISGLVQMTFGNLAIVIMGICDIIAAIADGPGGLTVNDAWNRMTSKMTLNTEEAMGKIALTTSRGMSQMLNSTEESLIQLNTVIDSTLKQVPGIVSGNYAEASRNLAGQLTSMSKEQLTTLKGMNDTTKMMFQGIRQGMTVDQAANQVEWNLKQMSQAGRINGDSMARDLSSAMDQVNRQLSSKSGEASQQVSKNLGNVEKSVNDSAGGMQQGVTKESSEMGKNASKSAADMEKNVTSSTSRMADKAISDWNRIRNSYSNSINGRVSITKTTTEKVVQGKQVGLDRMSLYRLRTPDISSYVTRGSYYNYNPQNNFLKSNNKIDDILNKVVRLVDKINNKNDNNNLNNLKIEIPVYLNDDIIANAVYPIISNKMAIQAKKRG
ncbi:phage tail tape measure protein [uncultured Clostridium sp.]|uniref:phage tail tape measure protein n=1 Tax=uncultured Clostridium sp. TaxID=59620 RepID=UPI00261C55B2|nr:phage tail tape measure protein [uncultured Clostridium sp.]